MKRWLSACISALLLLSLVGCGSQNPSTSQGSQEDSSSLASEQEESPNDCNNLADGGICIEKFEKNLQELGYDTSNRPEDWDDNIILVEASKREDGEHNALPRFQFVCMIRKDGTVYGAYFSHYARDEVYDDYVTLFSQEVEAAFNDICKAEPKFEDTFIREYIPIPEELIAVYNENRGKEYGAQVQNDPETEPYVSLSYDDRDGFYKDFFYHMTENH